MADGLPDLVSHVRLDTTGVTTGVAKTKAELGTLGGATKGLEGQFKSLLGSITGVGGGTSQLSGVFSKFTGSVGQARGAMAGAAGESSKMSTALVGVGAGAAAAGVAIGALAVEGLGKFISAAGQVRGLAATLGATAEDASKLRNVAIGLGVDVDTMGKAFFKLGPILEKNQGDIAGVHVEFAKTQSGGLDYIGTLDNLRAAYQQLTDPAQKAAFALELFKKTGQELRPILSATNEQFAQLAKTGPIFNDRDLKAAKDLGIAQRELKQAIDGVEIALGKTLAPALTKVATVATGAVEGIEKVVGAVVHLKDAGGVAGKAFDIIGKIGSVVGEITPAAGIITLLHLSHKKAAGSAQDQAEAEKKLAADLAETEEKAKAAAAAFDKLVESQENSLDADIRMDHALRDAVASADGVKEAQLRLADAHQNVIDKQAELVKVQKDGTSSADDIAAASRAVEQAQLDEKKAVAGVTDAQNAQRDALIDAARAVRDKKVADAEAAGETVNAEGKLRLFIGALRDQAGTLAPGSPLRTNLEDYANKLENGIPREVNTKINADTSEAMAKIAELNDAIDRIETRHAVAPPSSTPSAGEEYTYSPPDPGAASYSENERPPDEPNASGNILGPRGVIRLARGGRTGRTRGFITSGPRFLVGEGDPRFPEAVIATDPKYRRRNLDILSWATRQLGVGGITGASGGSSVPMPAPIDYKRIGAEVAAALRANPSRSYVVASDVARGLGKAGPR